MKRLALLLLCAGCSNTQNDEGPGNFVLDAAPMTTPPDAFVPPPPPVDAGLIINEVSATADYVELVNTGGSLDLTGWSVTDDGYDPQAPDAAEHRFALPMMIMPVGERLLLDMLPFGIGSSDRVTLLDPAGNVIDTIDWLEGDADPSLCRLPDGQGDFEPCRATPGSTNLRREAQMPTPDCGDGLIGPDEVCDGASHAGRTCESFGLRSGTLACAAGCQGFDLDGCLPAAPPMVTINEVTSRGDDYIELAARGEMPADLSGWAVADSGWDPADPETETNRHVLPAGTVIEPGAFLLLVKDVDHGFGLGGEDAVRLFDAEGALIDEATWPDGGADPSWCRPTDGDSAFEACLYGTPGASNQSEPPPDPCGNDAIDADEVCDGAALDGQTCADFDFAGGELRCADDCAAFDTSGCEAAPLTAIVVLNEMRSSEADEIELHNLGDAPADLTGWAVADDGYDPADDATLDHLHVLDGMLQPGAYRVLVKDVDHGFGLGGEDGVRLFDATRELVDETAWPDGEAAISWCRQPDGEGPFGACAAATLGEMN